MPLLELTANGIAASADRWVRVADGGPAPEGCCALVGLGAWQAARGALRGRNEPVGVELQPHDDPQALAGDLDRLSLIAVRFPAFTDGRGYSTARILREHLGWRGPLRATGDVLRDQLLYLARCGFDQFETVAAGPDDLAAALAEFSRFYQPTGDGRRTVPQLRHPDAAPGG